MAAAVDHPQEDGLAGVPARDARLRRLLVGLLALGFVALAVTVGAAIWMFSQGRDFSLEVNHTYHVETELYGARAVLERAESARRGYLLVDRSRYLKAFNESLADIHQRLQIVRSLTADNAEQTARINKLIPAIDHMLGVWKDSVARAQAGDRAGAYAVFIDEPNSDLLRRVRNDLMAMIATEEDLLILSSQRVIDNSRLMVGMALLSGLIVALLAGLSVVLVRRYTDDLATSERRLAQLNMELEARVEARTAALGRANEELQRYTYILSHDLRAPLVNVIGFTRELEMSLEHLERQLSDADAARPETVADDVRIAVRRDIPESLGFIRTSTHKMDRLISAMLKLSREGRRTLLPERLDMTALVRGVMDTLRHQAEQTGAEVLVDANLPEITNDRLAIEQIFGNLLENSLKYLKRDTAGRVRVSGSGSSDRVVFEVSDTGRGIDPKDHERIFDLFRRAGSQDRPGEGIGLAHVKALVERMGGTISVRSQIDQGAVFRIDLPRTVLREQEGRVWTG